MQVNHDEVRLDLFRKIKASGSLNWLRISTWERSPTLYDLTARILAAGQNCNSQFIHPSSPALLRRCCAPVQARYLHYQAFSPSLTIIACSISFTRGGEKSPSPG